MDRQYHSIQLTPSTASAAVDATKLQTASSNGGLKMPADLYLAACEGRTSAVMEMLRKQDGGGNPAAGGVGGGGSGIIHLVSAGGNTVLHLAAREGHEELIRELYTNFGDKSLLVSSRNSALDTPLHCAARAGHDGVVCLLLELAWECGAQSSLSCKNEAGDTALHLAARLGHGAIVEAMVSQEPVLASEVNYAGMSPMYLAVISGSVPAVRAITTKCVDASAAGPGLQNALHAAIFQSSEMVDLLLQWKPSLASDVDENGSSPLHFASSDGDRSIVRAILHAVPPNTTPLRDSDGRSALHVAAGMDHSNIVKELMKACPDSAELRDDRGRTFLHAAAKGGCSKVVALAIKKPMLCGLLNTQDGDGNTPLHLAVEAGMSRVVEDLIRHGRVRAGIMNNDGHTPLDLAAKSTRFFSMLSLVVTLTAFGARARPQRQDRVEKWSDGGEVAKGIQKTSDSLAVVAILIATVAFSASNNIPGSYKDDGTAALQEKIIFKCYLVLNSVALMTSVAAVLLLVYGKVARSSSRSLASFVAALHFIWVSLIAMIVAFYVALSAVTNTRAVSIVMYIVLLIVFPILGDVAMRFTGQHPLSRRTSWKSLWSLCRSFLKGRHAAARRRVGRKYPFANIYVPNTFLFNLNIIVFVTIAGFIIGWFGNGSTAQAANSAGARAPLPSIS